ncbi:MAG: HEAT repeat domain-containing protein [Armatimonadetes bacterium]|nr:HEAT repeat domain-containing protein [Armatimonadota bacterium]
MHRGSDVVDTQRLEAARQAVRAIAAASKSVRLYSAGHLLARKGIDQAVTVLKSYADRFGPLTLAMTPRGVVVEFSAQPIEDDLVHEFVRALRAGFVRTVQILGGISARDLGEFLRILPLPQQQIRASGGVSRLLREQGVASLVVEDLGEAAVEAPAAGARALMQAIRAGPDAVGVQLLSLSGGDHDVAVRLIKDLDRLLSIRPAADQQAAHQVLAQALLGTTRFHRAVAIEVIRALDEPFAISIAARWPAVMVEDLAAAAGSDRSGGREMVVRALGEVRAQPRREQIPVDAVARPEIQRTRALLQTFGAGGHRHALARLIDTLPLLDDRKFEACLHAVEREFAEMEQVDDQVSMLADLAALSRRMEGARAELARSALHRILTTQVRDRLALALGRAVEPHHPLATLIREAPDEAALLLLEFVAEESRLSVRREIVDQLQALARGRIQLLAAHLVDPRWYIARNVVTVLGATGQPEAAPYLRAALSHADVHVRKEALHALAQIRTTEAVGLMAQALAHSDPQTQQAAAHWLGMTGSPDAADALIALVQSTPLHEAVEVKREAIRSLGRLGTPEAEAALQRILSARGVFNRRQLDDLRAEARKALAALHEVRP